MAQHPLPSVGHDAVMVQIGPVRASISRDSSRTSRDEKDTEGQKPGVRGPQDGTGPKPTEQESRLQRDGDADAARRKAWESIEPTETENAVWFRKSKSARILPEHARPYVESVEDVKLGRCWKWVAKRWQPQINLKYTQLPTDPQDRDAAIKSAVKALIDKLVEAKIDPLP